MFAAGEVLEEESRAAKIPLFRARRSAEKVLVIGRAPHKTIAQ